MVNKRRTLPKLQKPNIGYRLFYDTKSPYPIKRLEAIRILFHKEILLIQSLFETDRHTLDFQCKCSVHADVMSLSILQEQK